MATYNQDQFIEQSLDSALSQTYSQDGYEILVVNDGSTDSTPEILRKYERRIRVIHQQNKGLSASCNIGIQEARGTYFVRLDSDDVMDPDTLTAQARTLDSDKTIVGVSSDRYVFSEDSRQLVTLSGSDLFEMVACGVMLRTNQLRKIGGYRRVFWEEYDLYLRLLDFGRFAHIPRPLYYYRRHQNNMTNLASVRKRGWLEIVELHGKEKLLSAGDVTKVEELHEVMAN